MLTTMAFATLAVCGLDYTFTIADALGVLRLVSTPSLSGLARDRHLTAFPEFEGLHFGSFLPNDPVS